MTTRLHLHEPISRRRAGSVKGENADGNLAGPGSVRVDAMASERLLRHDQAQDAHEPASHAEDPARVLRSLDRAGIDWDTIGASIRKTNNVVVVEQGSLTISYGAMLSDEIQRRFFDHLDQPVKRVCGAESSPSVSKVLERAAFAMSPEIQTELRQMLADTGKGDIVRG